MTPPKRRILTTATTALLVLFSLTGCGNPADDSIKKPITLQWWRVSDSVGTFDDIVAAYQVAHPNVKVQVRVIRPEEFDQVALEALASGTGPDIVSLPNTSLRSWRDRLTPLPKELELTFIEVKGLIKKEPLAVTRKIPGLTFRQFKDTFIDAVGDDAVIDSKIYALPFAFDSLLLYYNQGLLAAANLPHPPATWTDFKDNVQRMVKLDPQGHLLRSGAGLGTADNVPYAADILSALMLQNGTRMVDPTNSAATFDRDVEVSGTAYTPGADAVRFYTDFANPTKETYTWSGDEPPAWEAFAAGKVAFTFGYWRDRATLAARGPQVDIGVATFPQIDGNDRPAYYASYYLEAVTKQSKYPNEAWGFLQFATKPEQALKYINVTKRLTAHRAMVQSQLDDLELGTPAKQLLTSKSWYRGLKPKVAESALLSLIRQVVAGGSIDDALSFASRQVSQTLPNSR